MVLFQIMISTLRTNRCDEFALLHPAAPPNLQIGGDIAQPFKLPLSEQTPEIPGPLRRLIGSAAFFAALFVDRSVGYFLGPLLRRTAFLRAVLNVFVLPLIFLGPCVRHKNHSHSLR